jgi:rhamnopyranosyl-N-acetylglucosaminyl-diphospho-decaprenol beta-1,3/1,4-galactofuranosyltransferase
VHAMDDVRAAAVDGLIRDIVIPFNGVLLTRALV